MNAKIKAKMTADNRMKLEDVIPLDTPFTFTVEPTNYCNLRCVFCFQHDRQSINECGLKLGYLDFDLYKKAIDDLKEFPQRLKKLKIGGFGEPLLHKDLPRMIEYAKKHDAAERIDLFTNGILLNRQMSSDLVNAGLDWINISVNGVSEDDYYKNCGHRINLEEFQANVKDLYSNRKDLIIYIKLGDNGYTDTDRQKFYSMFGDISDEIYIEPIAQNVWVDFDSQTENIDHDISGRAVSYRQVCTMIFTSFLMTSSGKIVACCADWKSKYVLGDVADESLLKIWKGGALRKLQEINLKKERQKFDLCRECMIPSLFTPDDIDNYADELLKKIK